MISFLMTLFRFLPVILSLVAVVLATEAASRSYYETRGKKMGWPAIAMFAGIGALPLIIHLITKSWFLLFLGLQLVICFLQYGNEEGEARYRSWSFYSMELIVLSFVSYAGYLDKGYIPSIPVLFIGVAISILPFLIGRAKVVMLEGGGDWLLRFRNTKAFTIILAIVTVLVAGLMILVLSKVF